MFQENRPPDSIGIEERSLFIVHSISKKNYVRNLIMTEDQSIVGKRRIYYDPILAENIFYTYFAAEKIFRIKPIKHIVNLNSKMLIILILELWFQRI